ncbi:hypothetical protein AB0533_004458 [Vibrio parahaemolyticus]|uniref:hypothetical protein n=1 Tax=Vibrio parahaemolyticus TaxID=670 RepID=UPI001E496058|nr:hypothetical protein [Vibrio parahaemolyticus]ELB2044404.1 hypothetical protein [Vibrio parahaemolyticus]
MNKSEAAFQFHNENSSFWYQKSVGLYASASLIAEARQSREDKRFIESLELKGDYSINIGCEHPYLMLMGLSFEVILKAICIEINAEFSQVKHDLQEVAKSAGVQLSRKETTQLRLLSDFVLWEGRYPVAKKHSQTTQHWNATRKELWKTENILGFEVTGRTDIFEHATLKSLWLKLQAHYWDKRT